MRKILLIFALFLASPVLAANIYVAQSQAGANTGADCADARAGSSLGQSDWAPGNTIHLCGTWTIPFTVGGSGTAANPITVKAEAGAGFSFPAIPNSGAIVATGVSWVILDGGGGNCGFVNLVNVPCSQGYIKSTANGTGLANQVNSLAINADGTANVTIKGWLIGPVYNHTSVSDTVTSRTWCVRGYSFPTNLTIINNTMHDVGWCLDGGGPGLDFEHNEVYNMDHGVGTGGPISGAITIQFNHFHDTANWDNTGGTAYHHDGIHLFTDNGAIACSPMCLENANVFDGDIGNNDTAWIYNEGSGGNLSGVVEINNLAYSASGRNSCCGYLNLFKKGSNGIMVNNTVYGPGVTPGTGSGMIVDGSQTNATYGNNIIATAQNLIGINNGASLARVPFNNVYFNTAGSNSFSWHGSIFGSFTTWVSDSGETGGVFDSLAHINLDANGVPLAGSVALCAGTNLSSLNIAALDLDITGKARPGTGSSTCWDAGAYQISGNGAPPPPPPPPPPPVGAPAVGFSPTSASFSGTVINTSSGSTGIVLTNTGTQTLNITSVGISGTNAADFSETDNCGATLAATATCTINATFSPKAIGTRTASVSVVDNASGSPHTVPLSGVGINTPATANFSPTSLVFANTVSGQKSATQSTTLTNNGTATLNITSVSLTGTNSADYSITANTCGATLAGSASCSITAQFSPSAIGTRIAAISVVDDASGSPQTVPLSGNGTNPPGGAGGGAAPGGITPILIGSIPGGTVFSFFLPVSVPSGTSYTLTFTALGTSSTYTGITP